VALRSLVIRLTTEFVAGGYATTELEVFPHICLQLTDQLNIHRYTLKQLSKTKAEITDPVADGTIQLRRGLFSADNSAKL
jgi:hypothetical protein